MSDIDELVRELKKRRDELRVQMNLASKELKEEWNDLEARMEKFSARARLDKTGEGVGAALGQLGNELKVGYERIRDALKRD